MTSKVHMMVRLLSLVVMGAVLTATKANAADSGGGDFMCLAGGQGSSSCSYDIHLTNGLTLDSCEISCLPTLYACCGLKSFWETGCECRS